MKQKISVTVFSLTLLMSTTAMHASDKAATPNEKTPVPSVNTSSSSSSSSFGLEQSYIEVDDHAQDEENLKKIATLTNQVNTLKTSHQEEIRKLTQKNTEQEREAFTKGCNAYIAELPATLIARGLQESITNPTHTTQTNPNPQRNVIEAIELTAAMLAQPVAPTNELSTASSSRVLSPLSSSSSSLSSVSSLAPRQLQQNLHARRLSLTSAQKVENAIASLQKLKENNSDIFAELASSKNQQKQESTDQKSSRSSADQSKAQSWGATASSAFSRVINSGVGRKKENLRNSQN